jgi:hypothetical protein
VEQQFRGWAGLEMQDGYPILSPGIGDVCDALEGHDCWDLYIKSRFRKKIMLSSAKIKLTISLLPRRRSNELRTCDDILE